MKKNLLNIIGILLGITATVLIWKDATFVLKVLQLSFLFAVSINFKIKKINVHTYIGLFVFTFTILANLIHYFR